jgi:hypothetical protein
MNCPERKESRYKPENQALRKMKKHLEAEL